MARIYSSSLQRIENTNERLESAMDNNAKLLQQIQNAMQHIGKGEGSAKMSSTTKEAPKLSLSTTDELSTMLMKNSQVKDENWSAIGIAEWIHAGRWWLLQVNKLLYSEIWNRGISKDVYLATGRCGTLSAIHAWRQHEHC